MLFVDVGCSLCVVCCVLVLLWLCVVRCVLLLVVVCCRVVSVVKCLLCVVFAVSC